MTEATNSQISMCEVESSTPDETFDFGLRVGQQLNGGEILLLSGPLGAGKTIMVKGICAALGIDAEEVTSPTFTLVNPHAGRLQLYHVDLYRLEEGEAAAHAIDLDDMLSEERAVIVIEWAERLGRYPLPGNAWRIVISGDGDSPRKISITVILRPAEIECI